MGGKPAVEEFWPSSDPNRVHSAEKYEEEVQDPSHGMVAEDGFPREESLGRRSCQGQSPKKRSAFSLSLCWHVFFPVSEYVCNRNSDFVSVGFGFVQS